MRATVEFHGVDNPMPPIKVIIADGEDNEDVVIKVSDEGNGVWCSEVNANYLLNFHIECFCAFCRGWN
jgi:pyruvate dehydrogenase kinase 2/3/4